MQTLQHLSKHIAYLTPVQETDRPVLAAVTGNKKTLIIDAGNSVRHAQLFKDELLRQDISGNFLVLTHSHWDHVFGLENIKIPVICQEKTYTNMKDMQQLSWEDQALDQRVEEGTEIPFCADAIKLEHGTNREITFPLPDIIFEKTMTIDLGNITCIIEHVGGDHAKIPASFMYKKKKRYFWEIAFMPIFMLKSGIIRLNRLHFSLRKLKPMMPRHISSPIMLGLARDRRWRRS